MALASVAVSELLLILKIAFLVLLYVFIWRIVRAAAREVRAPQESMILSPQQAAVLTQTQTPPVGPQPDEVARLVVLRSPVLREADFYRVDSVPITIGRSGQNDVVLEGDEFVSALHARLEARSNGVFVEDTGSTNGTFVNGIRIAGERKLIAGDTVRVGETEFRYEERRRR